MIRSKNNTGIEDKQVEGLKDAKWKIMASAAVDLAACTPRPWDSSWWTSYQTRP